MWMNRTGSRKLMKVGNLVIIPLILLTLFLSACSNPNQGQPALSTSKEVFIQVPLTRQATDYTCGVACLQSILYYYGEEIREDRLAKELGSDPDQGTSYQNIIACAQSRSITVDPRRDMTLDNLKAVLREKKPVMVAIQAWTDNPANYADDWDDGHWTIAVGYDAEYIYFMDPSTLGNFTFIKNTEFLSRWHDIDAANVRLTHFGLVFSRDKAPVYDPDTILPLSTLQDCEKGRF